MSSDTAAALAYLARALKTPTIAKVWEQMAATARSDGWSHEEYLAAVLQRQVADREASGTRIRIGGAHRDGRLEHELKRLRRYKLLIIDEVGYLPFDADQANLFFQLVAHRYEQGSILITSNMPFGRWGEIFHDDIVTAAMIDRHVHHAEVLALSGDSYRTRSRRELLNTSPERGEQ